VVVLFVGPALMVVLFITFLVVYVIPSVDSIPPLVQSNKSVSCTEHRCPSFPGMVVSFNLSIHSLFGSVYLSLHGLEGRRYPSVAG